jgi:hypothetical protein
MNHKTRFEFLTAVLLKIQLFRDATLRRWVSIPAFRRIVVPSSYDKEV